MTRRLTEAEKEERAERRRQYARDYMKKRYWSDPVVREKLKAEARAYRQRHRERVIDDQRKRYHRNRDRILVQMRDKYKRSTGYRAVAEQMIGRPLQKGEHVHHIDCDHDNNVPENLHVMSAGEHIRAHTTLNALAKQLMADGIIAYDRESKSYKRLTAS